ncbi:MAG: CoA transferase [Chloroflexi bacterium]|nr:CoA transferase [Chloroflexota bacterium]
MDDPAPGGPLTGVRVLDIAVLLASPFAAALLGDFGAEVIKVELPGSGDGLRRFPPFADDVSLHFAATGRNKKAITLDLRAPRGRELFLRLLAQSDVVVENFLPGTLESWGLSEDVLREVHPGLVLLRISGYGQTGPYRMRHGFGTTCQAISGLTYLSGYPDRPPVNPPYSQADYIAGLFGALGVMFALYHRDARGGRGQTIDLGLYEGTFRLLEFLPAEYLKLGILRERTPGPLSGAPVGIYQTADGKWVVVTVSADRIFQRFCQAIGRPELAEDPRYATNDRRAEHREDLDGITQEWVGARPLATVVAALDGAGVPTSPVYSIADIVTDPQYQARENIVTAEDPRIGPVPMPNVVPRLSRTPGSVRRAAPRVGEHNEEVYCGLLGLGRAELETLRAERVV